MSEDKPRPRPSWRPSGFVTLLTDFGLSDTYVGVMKGVLARHHPRARAVDLTHAVPPQDVRAAALHLASAWTWFPRGSVHVCVVDPGVGSGRRILVGEQGGHAFLAPDNGLLSGVLAADAPLYALDFEAMRALPQVTPTDGSKPLTAIHGDVNLTGTINDDNPDNPVVQFIADTEED